MSQQAAMSAAAAPPKVARVGNYKLGKTLGIGSFCKVKLATHEPTGQKVAIKILNRKKLKKQDMGEKFRTEIHILRLFTHPHIIRLYEVIDTPTDIYQVMEYLPNGELFDYIVARGKLDESEARGLFQQIISGVEYSHVHGVVHRDLKPENLLLDADHPPRIKIADFGLSNRLKDGMFLKTSCGSPNYAAPEVISGALYAGPEVDIWSCGVILYALLCGSLPFDDENIRALFRKIKGGTYTIPSHVSPGPRELLSKMLVVDPLKRISISQIMQHPWYRQHLPLYLSLSAEQQIAQTTTLDENIISRIVTQHGFTRERLLKALSVGHELLTSRKYANQIEARKMAVIYNLLRDAARRKEQNVDECVDATADRPKDSANNVTDVTEDLTKMSPFAAATLKTLMQQTLQHQHEIRTAINHPSFNTFCLGGRWQLGVSSNVDAQSIMNEIYRILRKFNFEWKVLSLFRVKARYPAGLVINGKPVSSSEVCKIGIQLYKTSGRDQNVGMITGTSSTTSSSASNTPTQSPHLGPSSLLISPGATSSAGTPTAASLPQCQGIEQPTGAHVIDMQKLAGQMFLFTELSANIIAMLEGRTP